MNCDTEKKRLESLCVYEKDMREQGYSYVVGVDEAGRGPLAGPVVAAACFIPEGVLFEGIDDSKRLTPEEREILFKQIRDHLEVDYGVGIVDSKRIDEINILQATFEAMSQAINQLKRKPDFVLVDGSQLPSLDIPCKGIVEGDSKALSIAAASILAKVTRDHLMVQYHELWPEYNFAKHKGYATSEHLALLKKYGPCTIHRYSFEPLKNTMK